jgi:hypothetical protein
MAEMLADDKKAARGDLYQWAVGEGIIQPREERKK